MASYIVLKNSDSTLERKFRVVRRNIRHSRQESLSFTNTHDIDLVRGAMYDIHDLVILLRESEAESGYGDREDLITFFKLNSSTGTPSDVITYTDNEGDDHTVFMIGNMPENPIAVHVVGNEAWFHFKLRMLEKIS